MSNTNLPLPVAVIPLKDLNDGSLEAHSQNDDAQEDDGDTVDNDVREAAAVNEKLSE